MVLRAQYKNVLEIFEKTLDLIFPKHCVSCHAPGDYLCFNCFSQIQFLKTQYCAYCQNMSVDGSTHSQCQKRLGLDGLISAAFYHGPIQSLIKSLKYSRIKDLEGTIKQLLTRFLVDEDELFLPRSVVIPVPLHFLKRNFRGFNQAQILGQGVAQVLDLEFKPNILTRQRFTVSQTGLKKRERSENIAGAFAINPQAGSIVGKNIVLVDDVWTTGATIKECSKVLKQAGAANVWALTLARDEKKMV